MWVSQSRVCDRTNIRAMLEVQDVHSHLPGRLASECLSPLLRLLLASWLEAARPVSPTGREHTPLLLSPSSDWHTGSAIISGRNSWAAKKKTGTSPEKVFLKWR